MSIAVKAAGGNIRVTATIPNATPAGRIIAASLQWTPVIPAAAEIIIPTQELWLLKDCYVTSDANAGGQTNPVLNIKKDNDRLLDTSEILNVVNVTSAQRPNGLHANLQFEGGTHMTIEAVIGVAATAARAISAIVPFEKSG